MSKRDGRSDRRRRGGSPTRRSRRRAEKATVLIVSAGRQTEPNYFDGLKRDPVVRARFAVTVKRGRGRSPQ